MTSRLFASSAAWASASFFIRSISSFVRPDEAVIVMFCCLAVALSRAETFRIPFASMSNVTSTCGTPRGAGGIPSRWKRPSVRLSRAMGRSPWTTCTSTDGWLSEAVVKVSGFFVGIVGLASMRRVITPPRGSVPRDSGGHHLVRVDGLVGLLAEELLDLLLHLRHAGLTAHQDDLVEVAGADARLAHGLPARGQAALDEVRHEGLELGPREREHEVLGPARVRRDKRQVDLRLDHSRQLALGFLPRLLETLEGHAVLPEIDAVLLLELVGDPVHDFLVEVVAAEVCVAVGRLDLDHALADLEDGDVEGTAAQVIHGDRLVLLLVEAIGQRRGGGLVDDTQHLEARDGAGVLGCLALAVVEIRDRKST